MRDHLVLLISTALVNNVVLVKFLGICPFLGVSKKLDQATGMSLAVIFVEVLATAVNDLTGRSSAIGTARYGGRRQANNNRYRATTATRLGKVHSIPKQIVLMK